MSLEIATNLLIASLKEPTRKEFTDVSASPATLEMESIVPRPTLESPCLLVSLLLSYPFIFLFSGTARLRSAE